jgi:hypothetical protein
LDEVEELPLDCDDPVLGDAVAAAGEDFGAEGAAVVWDALLDVLPWIIKYPPPKTMAAMITMMIALTIDCLSC